MPVSTRGHCATWVDPPMKMEAIFEDRLQLDNSMDIYDDLLEMSRDEQSRSHCQNAKHDMEEMVSLKRTVTSLQQRLQEMNALKAVVATLQQKVAEIEPLKAKVTTLQTKVTELEGTVEKMKKAKTTSEPRKSDSSRSRGSSRDSHHSSSSSKEKARVRNHRGSRERIEETKNKRVTCNRKLVSDGKDAPQSKDIRDIHVPDKEMRVKYKLTPTERSHKEDIAGVNQNQETVASQKEKQTSTDSVSEKDQKEVKSHGDSRTEKNMKKSMNLHDWRTDVENSEKLSKQLSSGNKGKGSDSTENKSVEKLKLSENRGFREKKQNISKQSMTDKKSEVSRKRKLSGESESSSKKSKTDTRKACASKESVAKRITIIEKRKPHNSPGSDVKSFPNNKRQKVTLIIDSIEKQNGPLEHIKATGRKSDFQKSSDCSLDRKSKSCDANVLDVDKTRDKQKEVQNGTNAKSKLNSKNSNASGDIKKSLNYQQERSKESKEKTSIKVTKTKQELPAHSISSRGGNLTKKGNSIRPHSSTPKSKGSITKMDHVPIPPQSPVTNTGQDTGSTCVKDGRAQRNLFGERRLSEDTTNVKPSNLNANNISNDVCSCNDDSLSSQDTSRLIREIFGSSMVEENSENKPDTNVKEKMHGKPDDTVANKVSVKTFSTCVQKLPLPNLVESTKVSIQSSAKSLSQTSTVQEASRSKMMTEHRPVTDIENFDNKAASLRGEKLQLTRSDHPLTAKVKVKHAQDKTGDMLSDARDNWKPEMSSGTKNVKEEQSDIEAHDVKVPSGIPTDHSCSTECTIDLIDRSVRDESKDTLPSISVDKVRSLQTGECSQSDDIDEEYEVEEEIIESMERAQPIKIQRISDSQDEEIDVMGEWSNGDEASNQSLAQQVKTSVPTNNGCTRDSSRPEVDVNKCHSPDITSTEMHDTTVMPQENLKTFVESTCTYSSDGFSNMSDESASRDSFTNGPVKGLITETVSTTTSYGGNYLRMGVFSVMDSSKQRFDTGDAVIAVTSTSDIKRQNYLEGRESCKSASVVPPVSVSDVQKTDKPVRNETFHCVSVGKIEHSAPAPIAGNQRLNQLGKHTYIKSKDPQRLSFRTETDAEINYESSHISDVSVDVSEGPSKTSHKGTHNLPFHAKDKNLDADLFDETMDCGQNVVAKPAEATVTIEGLIDSESNSENLSMKSIDIDKMLFSSDVKTIDTRPCGNANVSIDTSTLPKALSGLLGKVTATKEVQPEPLNIDALLENKNLLSAVKNALTLSGGQSNTNMTAEVTADLAQNCNVLNAERTQVVGTSSGNVLETLQHQALKYRKDQNTTHFSSANQNNLLQRLQALATSTVQPGCSSRGSSQNKQQTIFQHQGFGNSNTNATLEKENVLSFRNSKDGTPDTPFEQTSDVRVRSAIASDNGSSGCVEETVQKKKRVFGSRWGGKEQVEKNPQKWLLVANYIPPRNSNRQRWTDLQRLQAFQKVSPVVVDRQYRR